MHQQHNARPTVAQLVVCANNLSTPTRTCRLCQTAVTAPSSGLQMGEESESEDDEPSANAGAPTGEAAAQGDGAAHGEAGNSAPGTDGAHPGELHGSTQGVCAHCPRPGRVTLNRRRVVYSDGCVARCCRARTLRRPARWAVARYFVWFVVWFARVPSALPRPSGLTKWATTPCTIERGLEPAALACQRHSHLCLINWLGCVRVAARCARDVGSPESATGADDTAGGAATREQSKGFLTYAKHHCCYACDSWTWPAPLRI